MALISIFHFKNTLKRYTADLHLYWSHSSSEEAGKLLARRSCQILLLFLMTLVEMVMIVKTMLKMILLMERLMMKMSNAWVWGGGCQGEN